MLKKKNILILGSGFGGVESARMLGKYSRYFKVTIVSDSDRFLYYPALYLLTSKIKTHFSSLFVNQMVPPTVKIINAKITGLNASEKKVVTEKGEISYDILIVALGSSTLDYGIPGVMEHMRHFRNYKDAEELREIIKHHLDTDRIEPVIIIGGGPVGIELSAYIASIDEVSHRPDGHPHIMMIEAMPRIAAQLSERVANVISRRLLKIDVSLCLDTKVLSYDGKILKTSKGDFISDTVLWSAGLGGNKLLKDFGPVDKRGRLLVDEFLAVSSLPDVYAIGDASSTVFSGLAQTAIADGEFVARNIILIEEKRKPKKYNPPNVAYAMPVGHFWAVVSFGPIIISGWLGHLIRQAIDYKYLLTHLSWKALKKELFGK